MISFAYRTLTNLGAPLINYYLRRRLAAGREDAVRFSERLGRPSKPRPEGFVIWCHAASVGEAISLLTLIDKLRLRYHDISFLLTTGTVTSARLIENRLPPQAFHQYMPVDRVPYVRNFLAHWKPDLVLWVESELWPNMLQEMRAKKIPAVLLNARMSDKSFRQWYRVRGWAKKILSTFSLCLPQTEAERGRFVTLGAKPVKCIGNLKYAAQPLPCDEQALETLKTASRDRPLWLMASTHRNEETIAAETHKQLLDTYPNLLTVIVPRHAVRGDEIAEQLTAMEMKIARRSKNDPITPGTHIYLADTMGELGLFYRLARIVAMGGSFTDTGGHNPVEPAQLDCALIFGPSMFNFTEITREFLASRAAIQLQHANELAFTINRLLTNTEEPRLLAINARLLADNKRHVLDDIVMKLAPWLPALHPVQDHGT